MSNYCSNCHRQLGWKDKGSELCESCRDGKYWYELERKEAEEAKQAKRDEEESRRDRHQP